MDHLRDSLPGIAETNRRDSAELPLILPGARALVERCPDDGSCACCFSASYWPGDLPALIFALTKAQEYVFTEPLPGEQPTEANDNATDKTPF
jgi:hypothetical protein